GDRRDGPVLRLPPAAEGQRLRVLRLPAVAQRLRVTPTRWQRRATGQVEQRGESGWQTFCPKATSRSLSSIQCRRGSFARSAHSARSGVVVRTKPRDRKSVV